MPEFEVDVLCNQGLENRICRKLDIFVLLLITVLLCVNSMDGPNMAYASVVGLIQDTHLQGNQFNNVLAIYFATYLIAALPSTNLLKKLKPNCVICFLAAMWGIVVLFTGLFVNNYGGLMTVRAILGCVDGGMLPAMVLYLSGMYKRYEVQSRFSIFPFSMATGALSGGIVASAIVMLDGAHKIAGWRWIFIIEGTMLMGIAIIVFCIIPKDLTSAWFLTAEERDYAVRRLGQDMHDVVDRKDGLRDRSDTICQAVELADSEDEEFEWREFWRGFFDIQTWLTGVALFLCAATMNGILYFMPTIIVGLGYSGAKAQLYSAPPYVLGIFLPPTAAILGDRLKIRGPLILCLVPLSIMGFIILLMGQTLGARYTGICFAMAGTMASIPSMLAIISNNSSGHYKRATAIAVQTLVGNTSGLFGTYIYTVDQQPMFTRGHSICLGLLVASWILIGVNVWENKARKEGRRDGNIEKYKALREAGKTKAPIGDRHPDFIFVI